MIVFLFGSGFRRFSPGMPVISSNSIAISAACHSSRNGDEILQSLKYGALSGTSDRAQIVGFSASEVTPLRDGDVCAGTPNLPYSTTQMCLEYIAFQKLSLTEQFYVLTTSLVLQSQSIKAEGYPRLSRYSEDRLSLYPAGSASPGKWRLAVWTQLSIFAANLSTVTTTEDEHGVRYRKMPHLNADDVRHFLRHLDRHWMRITRKSDSSTKFRLKMIEAAVRDPDRHTTRTFE